MGSASAVPVVDDDLAVFLERHRPMVESKEDGAAPQIDPAWPGAGRTFADIAKKVRELARTHQLPVASILANIEINGKDHAFPDYDEWLEAQHIVEIV